MMSTSIGPYLKAFRSYFTKLKTFLLHYEYLDVNVLHGFRAYKVRFFTFFQFQYLTRAGFPFQYKGVDTNPVNNQITMPLCDQVVKVRSTASRISAEG